MKKYMYQISHGHWREQNLNLNTTSTLKFWVENIGCIYNNQSMTFLHIQSYAFYYNLRLANFKLLFSCVGYHGGTAATGTSVSRSKQ